MDLPRLHPDTIEQVRQAADIVEIVSEHVVLRKQGRDFTGCCPFHDDKSPSFSVSPSKQFYYCFGCGAGGNAIKFLMELGKRSFSEVVLDLAQKYNVPVQTLESSERQAIQQQFTRREQILEILALTAQFYHHALQQPGGKHALTYATQKRRLDLETIQQFQLGYSPGGWQVLYDYLVTEKHYPVALVEAAGLILPRKGGGGYYDRFRDRLMIPIHDNQGRIVGFGSRTLTNEEPKYLNSPETEVFNKGKVLFGLDKAKQAIAKQDRAIVVEGYFDVIALHQANIRNVVASMGTALSQAQIRQLLRYTESKQILFNFDADKAGAKAAERAIGEIAELVYRGEVQLRVITIPNGKDADEFLKEAQPAAYQALVENAPLWLDWQIQQILAGADLRQADHFQQVSAQLVELLGKLPNASLRTHYVHRCAGLLSQGDSRQALQLEEALRFQVKGQRWHGQAQRWQRPADFTLREAAEAQLLRIYLHCASHRPEVHQALAVRELEFSLSHHRFLWRQILRLEDPFQTPPNDGDGDWVHPEFLPAPGEADIDLISVIKDLEPDDEQEQQHLQRIYPLLQLDETTSLEIVRPTLSIRAAAASLERIACEKRCRHLLELLEKMLSSALSEEESKQVLGQYLQSLQMAIDVETEHAQSLVDEENYYLQELHRLKQLYYQEKRYLEQLDHQRCISLDDLRHGTVIEYHPSETSSAEYESAEYGSTEYEGVN